jgi:hypothetical protein
MIHCILYILATKTEQILVNKTYAACPQNWIGSGNKCFYFSEYTSNWTFAQNFCMAQEAQLARFDNQDELVINGQGLVRLSVMLNITLPCNRELQMRPKKNPNPRTWRHRECECVPFADA